MAISSQKMASPSAEVLVSTRYELVSDVNMTLTNSSLAIGGNVVALASTELGDLSGGESDNILNASSFNGVVTLRGNGGNDTLTGISGNDIIEGGAGADNLSGNGGNDIIRGGDDDDTIFGGDDYGDYLYGDAGVDTISGGQGDDMLEGGAGNDQLTGNTGSDTYRFGAGALGTDTVTEAANSASDWLDFTNFGQAASVDLAITTSQNVGGGMLSLQLSSNTGIENVRGSAFNDSIFANTRSNIFDTAGGDDTVSGPGSQGVASNGGNDTFLLRSGNDTATGGIGNDTLEGGAGDDQLTGGSGNDTYVFGNGTLGTDTITEAAISDTDWLDFTNFGQGITFLSLSQTTSRVVAAGKLSLILSSSTGIENVRRSAFNDSIHGNSRNNRFETGAGNDYVNGSTGGNDTYILGSGDDEAYGGSGNDLYYGSEGNDYLLDIGGTDTGFGGSGTDTQLGVDNWTTDGPDYPA